MKKWNQQTIEQGHDAVQQGTHSKDRRQIMNQRRIKKLMLTYNRTEHQEELMHRVIIIEKNHHY